MVFLDRLLIVSDVKGHMCSTARRALVNRGRSSYDFSWWQGRVSHEGGCRELDTVTRDSPSSAVRGHANLGRSFRTDDMLAQAQPDAA